MYFATELHVIIHIFAVNYTTISMKRVAGMIVMSLATLLIIVLPFIPHHHHEDVECIIMERCESDGTINDEHTAHHTGDDGSDSHSTCVKNIRTLIVKSSIQKDLNNVFAVPLLCYLTDVLCMDDSCRKDKPYNGDSSSYKSISKERRLSLRAPPYFL